MKRNQIHIFVDINGTPSTVNFPLTQGSTNKEFIIKLSNYDELIALSDKALVKGTIIFPDNKGIHTISNLTKENSKETELYTIITVPIDDLFVSQAGDCQFILEVQDVDEDNDDIVVYTGSIHYTVQENVVYKGNLPKVPVLPDTTSRLVTLEDNEKKHANAIATLESEIQTTSEIQTQIDKTISNNLEIQKAIEKTVNGGVFGKLTYPKKLNTSFRNNELKFDDLYYVQDKYVTMTNGEFYIEEGDDLDPNITGGTDFLLALYFKPLGDTEITQNGYIELSIKNANTDAYLEDINNNIVGVRREYNAGDTVGEELLVSIVKVKGRGKIKFKIDSNISNDIIVASQDTSMLIQPLIKNRNNGIPELSFEQETGYSISKHSRFYGDNFSNFAQLLTRDIPEETHHTPHNEIEGDGKFFSFNSGITAGIKDYELTVKSNATDMPIYSIGQILDRVDTNNLKGEQIKLSADIANIDNAYKIGIMTYTGTTKPTLPILTGFNNGNPEFGNWWHLADSLFIPKNITGDFKNYVKDFTMPTTGDYFAFILFPISSQIPSTLKVRNFKADVVSPFTRTFVKDTSNIKEHYLKLSENFYKSVVKLPYGLAEYRYTVNQSATRLPIGYIANDYIKNDNSWHDAGSSDPDKAQGNLLILKDNTMTITYNCKIYNEGTTINDVSFFFMKNGIKVAESELKTTITKNKIGSIVTKTFDITVSKDDVLSFYGQSNKDDGFYVATTNHTPLIEIIYKFKTVNRR